ncbi:MAG: rod-binding protein [Nitrospinota bacterium]
MNIVFNPVPQGLPKENKQQLAALKKLSVEFESIFLKEVVKAMRKTVPKNDYLNGGNAEEIYKSMMDDQMAQSMAENGSSGIAQAVYNKLSGAYLNPNAKDAAETEK